MTKLNWDRPKVRQPYRRSLEAVDVRETAESARQTREQHCTTAQFCKGERVRINGGSIGKVIEVRRASVRVRIGLSRPKSYNPCALTKL